MEYGTAEEKHSPSQSQKTLAAHVDSRLFRGMANGGEMRAHDSEAFKKFKAGAKRIMVSKEVMHLLQGASATLRESQAEYQRGKLLPSQSQKQVSSDAQLQQQQLGTVAEANSNARNAGGAVEPARSTFRSRPGSAIERSKKAKTKGQKSVREDWGYFEQLGALRAAPSATAAACSNTGHAPEQRTLSWDAAPLAAHQAWEYSESDEDDNSNDPTWRDVLNTQRARRQQQSSFVEWSIKNRAASMIQATWRMHRHRIEKLATLTVEEAMRRQPTTPAEYHEIHQQLWRQQRSFRRSKSSASTTVIQAITGKSVSPALTEEDEESDSAAVSQQLLDRISMNSSKATPSEDVAEVAQQRVKFSEEDLSTVAAAAAATAAAAVAGTAKQASHGSSPSITVRKPRKPPPPVVEVPKKPKVKVQPWAGMVGREAAIMSTTKWKAAAKAAAAADAFSGAVHREGSRDSPHSQVLYSPNLLTSEHEAAPWEPINSAQAAAEQVESSSAVSSRSRSVSASPEPASGALDAASTKIKVSWEDVPEGTGSSGARSSGTTGPFTAAAASGKYSGSGSESSEHVEVSLSGAAASGATAPAAAPQVLQAQQEPRQERKQQHQRPWAASHQFLDGSYVLSLMEKHPWQHHHEKQTDRQQTELLQEEQLGQEVGSISGLLSVGTSAGAAEHIKTGSRASSLAGALVDFGVGMVSSMISFIRTGSAAGAKGTSSSSEGKSSSSGSKGGSKDGKGSGSDASAGHHISNTQEQLTTLPQHSSTPFDAINRELSIREESQKDLSGQGTVLPRSPAPVVAATGSSPAYAVPVPNPLSCSSGSATGGSSSPASSSLLERFLRSPPQPSGKAATGNTVASGISAQTRVHHANAIRPDRVGSLTFSTAAADEEVGRIHSAPRSPRASRAVLRRPSATDGPAAAGPDIKTDDLLAIDITLAQQAKQGEEGSPQPLSSLGRRFATARRMSQTVDDQHLKANGLDGTSGSNHNAALPAGPLVVQVGSPGAAASGLPSPNKRQIEERLLTTSVAGASMVGISSAGSPAAVKASGSLNQSPSSSGSLFALPVSFSSAGYWSSDRRLTPNLQSQQLLQQQQMAGLRVGSASANAPLQAAGRVSGSSMGADTRPLGAAVNLGLRPGTTLSGNSRSTDTSYRKAKSIDLSFSTATQHEYCGHPPRQQVGQMQGVHMSAVGHLAGQLPTSSFNLLGSQPGGVQGSPNAVNKSASVLGGVPGHTDMSTAASGPKLTESHSGRPQLIHVGAGSSLAPVQGSSAFLASVAAKGASAKKPHSSFEAASQAAADPEAGSKAVTPSTSKPQIGLSTGNGSAKSLPVGPLPALSGRHLSARQSDFGG